MEIKILQVFYDKNGLPYKDKERTVHYPITSGTFLGASNTTQIKFYYDQLDELNESTFVAVSKLPNGKIGSEILESEYDSELQENYAVLNLSSFYTQYKGDVYISLQGYQGGVRVEQDEDGIYQIYGTPTIQATGSIKLSIAYAPTFIGSGETENITLQRVLAELSTKLGIRQETLYVEELPTVGNPNVWYVINDDPNDTTKANIYIWNATTQTYVWVGDNTLDLGEYYTKEQGEQFEIGIDNRVSSVENELSSVAQGSPKGVYATLAALQAAHPTGAEGIYIVNEDGHWYYWNGSAWTDGGIYLSSAPDNSLSKTSQNAVQNKVVTKALNSNNLLNNQKDYELASYCCQLINIKSTYVFGDDVNLFTDNTYTTTAYSFAAFWNNEPIKLPTRLKSFTINSNIAQGTGFSIWVMKKNGNSYSRVSSIASLSSKGTGIQTYVNGVDFDYDNILEQGTFIAYVRQAATVGGLQISNNGNFNSRKVEGDVGNVLNFTESNIIDNNYGIALNVEYEPLNILDEEKTNSLIVQQRQNELISASEKLSGKEKEFTFGDDLTLFTDNTYFPFSGIGAFVGIWNTLELNFKAKIKSFRIKSNLSQGITMSVWVMKNTNGSYTRVGNFTFTSKGTGLQEYVNGTDFTFDDEIEQNCFLMLVCRYDVIGAPEISHNSNFNSKYVAKSTAPALLNFTTSDIVDYNYGIAFNVNFISTFEPYEEPELLPSKWNEYPTDATRNFLDSDDFIVKVTPTTLTNTNLVMVKGYNSGLARVQSCKVDFGAGTLTFYKKHYYTDNNPQVLETKNIGFTLYANRQYIVEMIMETKYNCILKITDTVTLESDSLEVLTWDAGVGWGQRTYTYTQNGTTASVDYAKDFSTQLNICDMIIVGDSFVEGQALENHSNKRYASLITNKLNGSTFIYSRGGASSYEVNIWLNEDVLPNVKAKYCVIDVGMNDSNYDTWKNYIDVCIAKVLAKEITPILCTIPPTSAGASHNVFQTMNAYIKSLGYKYIDIAQVLSINGDGTTQNTDLFTSDGVHPNIDGNEIIYKKFLIELPELFENY